MATKSPFQDLLVWDYQKNLDQRAKWLKLASADPKTAAMLKEACRQDIQVFINLFLWTYNPKKEDKYIPFILYPFQVDFVDQLVDIIRNKRDGHPVIVEKCREMGVTWLVLAVFFWFWLFEANSDFIAGSRKEEFVDKRQNPDTLFGKLKIMVDLLPPFLRPIGYKKDSFTHMNLVNPENGSMIKGESSNSDFARSGRYKASLMDEFAFWNNSMSAWSSAGESCNVCIAVSTPNPEGSGYFKTLVDAPFTEVIRLEHSLHPDKGAEWLAEQYKKKSPEMVAVEILIDYQGAIRDKIYSRVMDCPFGDKFDYNPSLPLFRSWDFGHGGADPTVILWWQYDIKTQKHTLIDFEERAHEDINYFANLATGKIEGSEFVYSTDELDRMERRRQWKPAIDIGDPYDLHQATITKTTIYKELAARGIIINCEADYLPKRYRPMERIEIARIQLKNLNVHSRALPVIESIAKAMFTGEGKNRKPKHDETSHARTSMEYYFALYDKLISETKEYKAFYKKESEGVDEYLQMLQNN